MAGRPYWSGQLKISLVSFGIQLFPATNSQSGVTFHQIDRATGQRIRHLNVIDGDDPVENSEIVKGYEYSKGKVSCRRAGRNCETAHRDEKCDRCEAVCRARRTGPGAFRKTIFRCSGAKGVSRRIRRGAQSDGRDRKGCAGRDRIRRARTSCGNRCPARPLGARLDGLHTSI